MIKPLKTVANKPMANQVSSSTTTSTATATTTTTTTNAFRCYVEINQTNHRLIFPEVIANKGQCISFDRILAKLESVVGDVVDFRTHLFGYLNSNKSRQYLSITTKRFRVANASKIFVKPIHSKQHNNNNNNTTRPVVVVNTSGGDNNRKADSKLSKLRDELQKELNLCEIIALALALHPDEQVQWPTIASVMRVKGHPIRSDQHCRQLFMYVIDRYMISLSKRCFSKQYYFFGNNKSLNDKKQEIIKILDSLSLKSLVKHHTWKSIERLKTMAIVRETVQQLVDQTSDKLIDCCRPTTLTGCRQHLPMMSGDH